MTTHNKRELPLSLCVFLHYGLFKVRIATQHSVLLSRPVECELHESRVFVLFTAIHGAMLRALNKYTQVY